MTTRSREIDRQPRFQLAGEIAPTEAARLTALFPRLLRPDIAVAPATLPPGRLWLLRPDGYVALSTGAGDSAAIAAYLARLSSGEPMAQTYGRPSSEAVKPA
jgi:hypothetical protein